jgi:putative DNA primase/helicase
MDERRHVFHFGDHLTVDGIEMPVNDIRSKFLYPTATRLPGPADTALTDADGRKIVDIAKQFRFTSASAYALLCGWIALAPICGALRWRPHVWLTGGTGSGKSTILELFVLKLLGKLALPAQGSSTEAGIRQELSSDARPLVIEESEQNDELAERRIQNILTMIRQASSDSEARTLRGTVTGKSQSFYIRSMTLLCSVQVVLKQQADRDRIAKLSLKPKRDIDNRPQDWKFTSGGLKEIEKDKTISNRLLRRIINLLPVTLQNVEIFAELAANRLGTQREGDQYGTLLAGCWSLMNSGLVTIPEAEKFIDQFDLAPFVEDSEVEESTRCLNAFMAATLRTDHGKDLSIHEVVCAACGFETEGVTIRAEDAKALLRRHQMTIVGPKQAEPHDRFLALSNQATSIGKLLNGTPWAADWRGQLLRETDVVSTYENRTVSFGSHKSKCIAIALRTQLPTAETEFLDLGEEGTPPI